MGDNPYILALQTPEYHYIIFFLYPHSTGGGVILFYLCLSIQDIFRHIFLSNY